MRFLPVFLDLSAGHVILAGSGEAALAKLRLLRAAGANVRWFSSDVGFTEQALLASHSGGHIGISAGEPDDRDLAGAVAVVSAAGGDLDERMAARARPQTVGAAS